MISLLEVVFDAKGHVPEVHEERASGSNCEFFSRTASREHKALVRVTTDWGNGGQLTRSLDEINRVVRLSDRAGRERELRLDIAGRATLVKISSSAGSPSVGSS